MKKSNIKEKTKKVGKAIIKELTKPLDASITIRLDAETKKKFSDICFDMGMTVSSAVSVFVNRVIKDQSIPFNVTALKFPKDINADLMTESELFSSVEKAHKEVGKGKYYTETEMNKFYDKLLK